MKIIHIVLGIAVIAIVLGSVISYTYLAIPAQTPSTSPTPTPTNSPTAAPTSSPTISPSTGPTSNPTAKPTSAPTSAPTASPSPTPIPQPAVINGAGASFPYPLINEMIKDFTGTRTWATVNYQSIGSGGGISALQAKTVDYAGSDAPLTASEAANTPNALHIPETIGAVTVAYNLPGIPTGLKLTGPIIADIYLGTITKWNDDAIKNLNPTLNLPAQNIIVVHRSESSGTSFVFTGYLSAVSTTWATGPGQGKNVAWPVGVGVNNNAGVAGTVEGNAYTIGYVELAYTVENNMKVAAIQNAAGNFVMPTLATTTAAAQSIASAGLPAGSASWTSVNILNAPGANSYPIVSFSYIIVYKELNVIPTMTEAKAALLTRWLWYMVHDGQNLASALSYAPLPSNVVQLNEATIQSITFNGQALPVT
ncbi:MAG: phosphate ABC transporter substrate-binding protein PstS [Candidatus Bathyarchaeota archaeon]|nr:phosphate ABC transporter substrate-binding protein PstS [Candidatus Bathyarchaeota archaeon]